MSFLLLSNNVKTFSNQIFLDYTENSVRQTYSDLCSNTVSFQVRRWMFPLMPSFCGLMRLRTTFRLEKL